MKLFRQISLKKFRGLTELVLILLLMGGVVAGFFLGCGKLSDDTNRPSDPIGTSGAMPFPIAPSASYGSFTLSLSADSTTIPADGVNFTTLHAYLDDSSGRSLAGYSINFQSDDLGRFSTPGATGGVLSTTSSGLTDQEGHVSVRFLGVQSGSCVIQASVDLNRDTFVDLSVRMTVQLTPGGYIPSSAGTYSLRLIALPSTIPADMATYSTIIAMLRDSAGGSVENFVIDFYTEAGGDYGLGYLENDPFGPSTLSSVAQGTTNELGDSSVYFYGARAGSALVQGCVQIPDLTAPRESDKTLCDTVWVTITEGPGVPGTGVAGVRLTVDDATKTSEVDCASAEEAEEAFEFIARVWDETGDLVGEGVRVEITGTGTNNNHRNDYYTDSTGTVTFSRIYQTATPGTYSMTLTATVIINGVTYTDTVNYTWTVVCAVEEAVAPTVTFYNPPADAGTSGSAISAEPVQVQVLVEGNPVGAGYSVLFGVVGAASPYLGGVVGQTTVTVTTNAGGFATTTLDTVNPVNTGDTITITATATVSGESTTSTRTITVP